MANGKLKIVFVGNLFEKGYTDTMKNLAELRKEITAIDEQLLQLFAKRFSVVEEVGEYKKAHDLPVRDKNREDELMEHLIQKGSELKMSSDFIKSVWRAIFQEAYRKEA